MGTGGQARCTTDIIRELDFVGVPGWHKHSCAGTRYVLWRSVATAVPDRLWSSVGGHHWRTSSSCIVTKKYTGSLYLPVLPLPSLAACGGDFHGQGCHSLGRGQLSFRQRQYRPFRQKRKMVVEQPACGKRNNHYYKKMTRKCQTKCAV